VIPARPPGFLHIGGCEVLGAEISRHLTRGGIIFVFNMLGLQETGVFHNATLIGGKNCALRFKRFEYQHIAPSHFSQMQPTFREPITDTAVSLK